jgi:hypothetical protein
MHKHRLSLQNARQGEPYGSQREMTLPADPRGTPYWNKRWRPNGSYHDKSKKVVKQFI